MIVLLLALQQEDGQAKAQKLSHRNGQPDAVRTQTQCRQTEHGTQQKYEGGHKRHHSGELAVIEGREEGSGEGVDAIEQVAEGKEEDAPTCQLRKVRLSGGKQSHNSVPQQNGGAENDGRAHQNSLQGGAEQKLDLLEVFAAIVEADNRSHTAGIAGKNGVEHKSGIEYDGGGGYADLVQIDDDDPVNIIKATSGGAVDHIIERHREDVDFTSKFRLDRFAKDCALDIVDEFDPDVMFLHLSLVDSTRHGYGIRHEKVEEAFDQCAFWLEEVLEHISRKTDLSELSLVVLGDHGHLNCRGSLSMNKLFADRGWVDVPFPEKRSDCRAFTHAAGVSAQVYVNDPTIRCEAEALFEELKQQGWLTNWFTKEAAAAHGLAGPFDYVLEAGEGYFFADAVKPAFFTQSWAKDGGEFIGKHGHFPARGDMPPFVLSHPGLESKETCDHSILDIAPTIAKVFRLPAEAMQGSSLL